VLRMMSKHSKRTEDKKSIGRGIVSFLGNPEILKLRKTAFLCSRAIPASIVLKCYDWAIEQREKGKCVISGFHSKIEKDVLHYLLASGTQPVVMVLARGMTKQIEPKLKDAVKAKRLLIITPFDSAVRKVSVVTAEKRNRFMINIADDIVIGYMSKEGMLEKIISGVRKKKISFID